MPQIRWAYGVMTVPSRRDSLFVETMKSLTSSGFSAPHLFVDGCEDPKLYADVVKTGITLRHPSVGVAGNWVLSIYELLYRNKDCERFALFQDDFVCSRNLRAYLSACKYPEAGYWNLYTFPSDHQIVRRDGLGDGWHESHQNGRGAVGLVFDRATLIDLLSSRHMGERPIDAVRAHRSIDGGVVEAMRKCGKKEYVHNPSLLQHTGMVSTTDKRSIVHKPDTNPARFFRWSGDTLADSFRGEEFDLLTLLEKKG